MEFKVGPWRHWHLICKIEGWFCGSGGSDVKAASGQAWRHKRATTVLVLVLFADDSTLLFDRWTPKQAVEAADRDFR